MPDEQDDQTPSDEAVTAPETAQQPPTDAKDDEDRKGGQKALQADLARERKSRQALERKLQEIEDAQLSELDRTKKEAEQLRKELEAARVESLRARIAVQHGITDSEDIELFLTGSNEELLTKQAERLAARLKAEEAKTARKTPAPDKSQGSRSVDAPVGSLGAAEATKRFGQKQPA